MTILPPALHLTTVDTKHTVRIEITGDIDYDTADLLLEKATAQLSGRPGLKDLHLHCAGIGIVDSMGLSILLMIGRRATAAQVRLHLDDRPAQLDRLLNITGTLDYFTATPPTGAAVTHRDAAEPPTTTRTAGAGRPTGPDTTT
ncbi:anti-sigma factor antagonist [Streptomyces sp. Act143]|uniref:STAS domain-containing protein n=1 Tax=Streptomyces sp. Act143 TaxID=2200760 RepID=UPI000D6813C5|nr:STAS domain-containing protein [Streptomyces sp. Act143]PWI12941.1 anti-sigma factor antagonist [Streptomyces sp. Act143]